MGPLAPRNPPSHCSEFLDLQQRSLGLQACVVRVLSGDQSPLPPLSLDLTTFLLLFDLFLTSSWPLLRRKSRTTVWKSRLTDPGSRFVGSTGGNPTGVAYPTRVTKERADRVTSIGLAWPSPVWVPPNTKTTEATVTYSLCWSIAILPR